MATPTLAELMAEVSSYKYNPSAIQRSILTHLQNVRNGDIEIVDPTNPFVFLLEASCVNTAAFMSENEALTRKLYPSLAQSETDLYRHMTDDDYIGRFATPATAYFNFMIVKEDLLSKMLSENGDVLNLAYPKKATIARNTEFTANELKFSLQYPIDIRQLQHGGIQITYDNDKLSPLQDLKSNVIDYEVRMDSDGKEFIFFKVPVDQFFTTSNQYTISSSVNFSQDIPLTDQFYYARVYARVTPASGTPTWQEIYTTHSDYTYDHTVATAVLRVADGILNVSIPQIYITNGKISGSIRVDIYQTKGAISLSMENYSVNAFSYELKSIDPADTSVFTAVFQTVSFFSYCKDLIVGGSDSIEFTKLREQVVMNTIGKNNLPITNAQIESNVDKLGFSIVKNVDVVTNRIFLATRPMVKSIDNALLTAATTNIEVLNITKDELVTYDYVENNQDRVTITPDVVYTENNSIISIVPKSTIDAIVASGPQGIASYATTNRLFYTPFHYVLDFSSEEFEVRPYYLNDPFISSIKFIDQNETTGYQVNTVSYDITKIDTPLADRGYKIRLYTRSNDAYKALSDANLYTQLYFKPVNESVNAYINQSAIYTDADGERVFEFMLNTTHDIDELDNLLFTNLTMYSGYSAPVGTPLTNVLGVVYATDVAMGGTYTSSLMDTDVLGNVILPVDTKAITNEEITTTFGHSLKTLWARSRTVANSAPYQYYSADVPMTYAEDVYETDPLTGSIFTFDINGDIVYNIIHNAGDPVLDTNGNPIYSHYAGDIILDPATGEPLMNSNQLYRQIDIMMIDAIYKFATETAAVQYRSDMIKVIVQWLTRDLSQLQLNLLDQTRVYFYPKKTNGLVQVVAEDGKLVSIQSAQSLNVKLYVNNLVDNNITLKKTLMNKTITVIDEYLAKPVVSVSDIVLALKSAYGQEVISVRVSGLGGAADYETVTIKNDSDSLSLKKRLNRLADNTLDVQEDINIEFVVSQIV